MMNSSNNIHFYKLIFNKKFTPSYNIKDIAIRIVICNNIKCRKKFFLGPLLLEKSLLKTGTYWNDWD